jgi:hypothetical protein
MTGFIIAKVARGSGDQPGIASERPRRAICAGLHFASRQPECVEYAPMTVIVAYCEHCGGLFKVAGLSLGPQSFIQTLQLKGNQERRPDWGEMAKIVDGASPWPLA